MRFGLGVGLGMLRGGGFDPRSIPDMALWLDASQEPAGARTTWTDRSGLGRDATGTGTNGTATLSGKRVMRFNGTTDKFATGNVDWSAVNDFTVCAVFRTSSAVATQMVVAKGYSAYPFASEGSQLYFDHTTTLVKSVQYSAGNNFNVQKLDNDTGADFAIRSVRVDRSLGSPEQAFTRDGGICVNQLDFGGNSAASGLNDSPFYIGIQGDGASFPLSGDIAEAIVFARRLSDDELRQVEFYQAQKWSLPHWSLMCLGDSITYGEATQEGWRGPLFGANANVLASRGTLTAPGTLRHEGHPSHKIANINADIASYWTVGMAREILLTIGTNDALTPADRAGMLTAYDGLLTTIDALAPAHTRIWCATLTPLLDGDSNTAVNSFNAGLAAVVAGHARARVVDVGSALTTDDLTDGIHPNLGGYDKLAARWASVLNLAAP